jgi:hypothetical protein
VYRLHSSTLAAAVAALSVAGMLVSSCGGRTALSPVASSTDAPAPRTPRPVPTPVVFLKTPQPAGSVTCPIGSGDETATCARGSSKLEGQVEAAIDLVIQQQPGLFDQTQESEKGSRQYKVLDKQAYIAGVLENLRAATLCADLDYTTMTRVLVKNANEFSEEFDIVTQNGFIQRAAGGDYRKTCHPSAFPVDQGAGAPPPGSGCGKPYPIALTDFACKIHVRQQYKWVLDSTPLISNKAYCAAAGYYDGRSRCPVRPDGPDREPCENFAVGLAKDTGQPGPTWTRNGKYCTGPDSGCDHDPGNPYALWVYYNGAGDYQVCADNGVCCVVNVEI